VELLGKIYQYILNNTEKELDYIRTYEEDYIKDLVNIVIVNNDDQHDDLPDDIDLNVEKSKADFTS